MKIKSVSFKSIALLMTVVMMISCAGFKSKVSTTSVSSAKKIKLKLYTQSQRKVNDANDPLTKALNTVYNGFLKANPNIELTITEDSDLAWKTKIKTMMASNEMTDVYVSQPSDLSVYGGSGVYGDMTNDFKNDPAWKNSFYPGALKAMQFNGKQYGVPFSAYSEGVFYNTDLFKKYKLTYPKTYDDLINVCKVFASHNIVPIAIGGKDAWPITILTGYLMDREAGYKYFEDGMTKKENTADCKAYIEASKKFDKLVKSGAFSKNVLAATQSDAAVLYKQEKAAMFISGSWEIGGFSTLPIAKKTKYANFPTIPSGKGNQDALCVGFGKSYCISSEITGEQRKAAIALVKWLTSKDSSKIFLEIGSGMTGTNPGIYNKSKIDPILSDVITMEGKAKETWPAYGELITPGYYDVMSRVGQMQMLGQLTPEAAVKKLEEGRQQFQLNK